MEVFCQKLRKPVKVPFYRLNVADEYNNKMGRVDVGDQLRNYYRFDHFMRKRKWWWSFWMWCMGMLLTNSYILYKKFCELHRVKPRYSHYEFVCFVGRAWLHPEKYFSYYCSPSSRSNVSTSSSLPEASRVVEVKLPGRRKRLLKNNLAEESLVAVKKFRLSGFTDATLSNKNPIFSSRMDKFKSHFPANINYTLSSPRCQLHTWATNSKVRKKAQVVRCQTCNVHLCIDCFEVFHVTPDLLQIKDKLCKQMMKETK